MAPSVSAGPWIPAPGEYYSEFRASHASSSDARVLFDGLGRPFTRKQWFEGHELVSWNELGWKKRMSLLVAVPLRSTTLRIEENTQSFQSTQTGLADLLLGLNVSILDGPAALTVEANWKAPLGYDRDANPALGQGQQDVSGALNFGAAIAPLNGFVQASAGYRYRFEDPLDEVFQSADVGFWAGSKFLVAGRYAGEKSIGTGDVPEDEIKVNRAGPELLIRVDDRFDVFGGSMFTFSSENVPEIDEYYVGVAIKHTRLNRLQGFLGGTARP